MPKNRHFGAGSDTMQQVHGAGVKQCQLVKNVENRINGLSIGIKGHFGMDPETNGVVKAIC